MEAIKAPLIPIEILYIINKALYWSMEAIKASLIHMKHFYLQSQNTILKWKQLS